jgi:hypothetical protein
MIMNAVQPEKPFTQDELDELNRQLAECPYALLRTR